MGVESMKIYISGPISSDDNYEKHFKEAETLIKSVGHIAINPVNDDVIDYSYRDFINKDMDHLKEADAIYLLSGWRNSVGAMFEKQYAETVGLPIFFEKSVGYNDVSVFSLFK